MAKSGSKIVRPVRVPHRVYDWFRVYAERRGHHLYLPQWMVLDAGLESSTGYAAVFAIDIKAQVLLVHVKHGPAAATEWKLEVYRKHWYRIYCRELPVECARYLASLSRPDRVILIDYSKKLEGSPCLSS